ncbi:Hypothetical predicted protein [Lecanosticta acicola]|uniref:Integral membrane protein n=1 Tax=Lecanosticta acicola TaxID=111012 RepID=A0AAI8YVF3_9PEZI|nr:Hypothetical predicted protein [Lecanosticta acicola]
MLTYFPYWDVSWLVAISFTLGSAVWVVNGFFSLFPLLNPAIRFPGEVLYGGGITAFIGVAVFEVGSCLGLLEAVNANRTGCFGWAVAHLFSPVGGSASTISPDREGCTHHHQNRSNLVGRPHSQDPDPTPEEGPRAWVWFPSPHDFHARYSHDLGFLASALQCLAATVFAVSGFVALPGILNHMSASLTDALFWTPQLVGAAGFIASSLLFMLETQARWWRPAVGTLGWHVGMWNLVGSVGFALSPGFGYDAAPGPQFQAALCTFWGEWGDQRSSGL